MCIIQACMYVRFRRSTVITFKLSPGLRVTIKPPKKGVQISAETLELEKLHAVLDSLREKPLSQSDTS